MAIGDNSTYPYASRCPGICGQELPVGQCVSAACQCVAYICDQLEQLGVHLGAGYNNASTWAGAARAQGFRVDGTPGVWSVWQASGSIPGVSIGRAGHVAIVTEIGPSAHAGAGEVYVSDYNFDTGSGPCRFNRHTLPIPWATFIHFADQQSGGGPPPPPPPTCNCPIGFICNSDGTCTPLPPSPPPPGRSDALPAIAFLTAGIMLVGYELRRRGTLPPLPPFGSRSGFRR